MVCQLNLVGRLLGVLVGYGLRSWQLGIPFRDLRPKTATLPETLWDN